MCRWAASTRLSNIGPGAMCGRRSHNSRGQVWLASRAVLRVVAWLIVMVVASLLVAAPALADGGAGGAGPFAVPGGIDSPTGTGGSGAAGSGVNSGAGGGAGAVGGAGGDANGIPGGAGGASAGAGGQNGAAFFPPIGAAAGGSGGGGGAHGFVGAALPGAAVTGGSGGNGGQGRDPTPDVNGTDTGGNGGGGGAGGWGAVVTGGGALGTLGVAITGGNGGGGGFPGQGSNASIPNGAAGGGGTGGIGLALIGVGPLATIGGAVTGGNGGNGGNGGSGAGGNSGDGGAGIVANGATLTILAPVAGGAGAIFGFGVPNGITGAGGIGVAGGNLNILVGAAGSVTGGLSGSGVRAEAIRFTGGTSLLELQSGFAITGNVAAFTVSDTLRLGGTANGFFDASNIGAAAQYRGFGVFQKTGSSTWTLTGTTTAATPWAINAGTLAVSADGSLGAAAGGLSFDGGILQFLAGFSSNRAIALNAGGGSFDTNGNNATLAGTIGGIGGLTKTGAGTLTMSGASTYTGATNVNAGTLQAGAANAFAASSAFSGVTGAALDLNGFNQTIGSLAGSWAVTLGSATLTTGGNNANSLFDGEVSGFGGLIKTGTGTFVLLGTSTYTGATAVNGGALIVNGSIAGSSGLTVDPGALLGGTGILPTSTINGTLSPGNSIGTITVAGNLAFGPSALYLVEVSSAAADRTNITGSAALAGTVLASFAPGGSISRRQTILSATGGLGGTTFSSLNTFNVPQNVIAGLSYDPNNVYLDLTAVLGLGGALNRNQQNVATAINGFFNDGGALPPNFFSLFGLTGSNLANGLTLLSGEAATGAGQGAFQLGDRFLNLMLDPWAYGRSSAFAVGANSPAPFAAEQTGGAGGALAYANAAKGTGALREPPWPGRALVAYEPRFSSWATGYGGTNRTRGDPAIIGSHDLTARTGGYAAGLDYHVSPVATLGFALAGGFSDWSLANGLGGGKSDALQAGLYGVMRNGPAYLAGAASFAQFWMKTERTAFLNDRLEARFNAQSYGGRLEGGWRFATPLGGVSPYAAIQAQSFRTPTYSETDLTGQGFGLTYNGRNLNATRGELGARFDHRIPWSEIAVISLQARAAWAHDWTGDPTLTAAFQSLPGASFIVNGARPSKDSALASAGFELRFVNRWSLSTRFDGEFADRGQTYAGTGTLRYAW